MTERQEQAVATFNSGSNCAQSVLSAFSDIVDFDTDQLKAVSAGFGGGMGMQMETCGAVTGAYMLFSLLASKEAENNDEAKAKSAQKIREFSSRFREAEGSIKCSDLMGDVDISTPEGKEQASEQDLFAKVCQKCVASSTRIAEEMVSRVER